ncbi:MAG: hypothetical protein ACE5H4_05110 [Candidatus Thorarchaeota archaeon]
MTEIPLLLDYVEPERPSRGPGFGRMLIVGLIIAIVVVAGVLVVFLGFLGDGGAAGQREIGSWNNIDVDLYLGWIYRDEFSVSSSEAQGSLVPDLLFEVSVDDTGSDAVSFEIHIAVYEIDLTTFDMLSFAGRTPYLVGEGTYTNSVNAYIDLYEDA